LYDYKYIYCACCTQIHKYTNYIFWRALKILFNIKKWTLKCFFILNISVNNIFLPLIQKLRIKLLYKITLLQANNLIIDKFFISITDFFQFYFIYSQITTKYFQQLFNCHSVYNLIDSICSTISILMWNHANIATNTELFKQITSYRYIRGCMKRMYMYMRMYMKREKKRGTIRTICTYISIIYNESADRFIITYYETCYWNLMRELSWLCVIRVISL
jgi:hypothetical protein